MKDSSYSEPLPPGPLGCPFRGFDARATSPKFGPGVLYFDLFQRLKRPKIFKFYSNTNKGIAIVSGYENSKAVLSKEFDTVASQVIAFSSKIVGKNSLRCCLDKKEHGTLRKLIGMATKPAKVSALIPAIQRTADSLVNEMILLASTSPDASIEVEDFFMRYTLEIACRHIIGLQDLSPSEMSTFLSQVKIWIEALYAGPDDTAWISAREYLVEKIEEKIKSLEINGPDDSTVSGMVYARDPDDPEQRHLTRDEIVDNTLLLILAGSETSAGTLTNCMLLLGLDKKRVESNKQATGPSAWSKLVSEQEIIEREFANSSNGFSRHSLDACTFLDGVVRESLRIKPVIGGSMRGTKETIVIDGYQIPAGWGVAYDRYNTHILDPKTFREDLSHMNIIQGFDPTRWQGDPVTTPDQDWIPFGIGSRYCLGADLAVIEMKIMLGVMAQKLPDFDLISPKVRDLDKAIDIQWREKTIIPVPQDGVSMKIRHVIDTCSQP
jgi:cytochrome P450